MATPKAIDNLQKAKKALQGIKQHLEPVVQRLKANAFERSTAKAQATVALSVGMMKYMGARLQGLDHGRKPDDPLRKELDHMRKVLAEMKARYEADEKKRNAQKSTSSKSTPAKAAEQGETRKAENSLESSEQKTPKKTTKNSKRKSSSPEKSSKKQRRA